MIPYEEGYKVLRKADPNSCFGNMHVLSLGVLSDSVLQVNRYMQENPPKKSVNEALVRAIIDDKFSMMNTLLYHGADPFVKDMEGTSMVDFMMNQWMEEPTDHEAYRSADILQSAHWRRIKRLAELLFECSAFRKVSTAFPICVKIAEFRYGHQLTEDETEVLCQEIDKSHRSLKELPVYCINNRL